MNNVINIHTALANTDMDQTVGLAVILPSLSS